MGIYRKRKNEAGRTSIALIVILLLVVMSVQIVNLYQKKQEYTAKETEIKGQLMEEEERSKRLKDYEKYTGSREYVEDTAKSKFGMVYDNEIIFKEK